MSGLCTIAIGRLLDADNRPLPYQCISTLGDNMTQPTVSKH